MRWQSGPFYTSVTDQGEYGLKAFNFPPKGMTKQLFGIQLGGFMVTITAVDGGVQKLTDLCPFLLGQDPVLIECNAGKLSMVPGCMKMYGMPGVVWGLTGGPNQASAVPMHQKTNDLKASQKTVPTSSKEVSFSIPSPEGIQKLVHGYRGNHQGQSNTLKLDVTKLFDLRADGKLEWVLDGQKELLDLLKVNGLKLYLSPSRKIAAKPKGVNLNLWAQHDDVNDGYGMLLFAPEADASGMPPHILQTGQRTVFPGGNSLKDLMNLPWMHELKGVMEKLVQPLVSFAVHLDTYVGAKAYQRDVTRGIPADMVNIIQKLAKLYKSQAKDKVERMLSYVTTSVICRDNVWCSSGLMFDPRIAAKPKPKSKPKDSDMDSDEDSDEAESDEEMFADDPKAHPNSRATSPLGKRKERSPTPSPTKGASSAKSTPSKSTPSKSTRSSNESKKAKKPKDSRHAGVGSDEDEPGSGSDEDEPGMDPDRAIELSGSSDEE